MAFSNDYFEKLKQQTTLPTTPAISPVAEPAPTDLSTNPNPISTDPKPISLISPTASTMAASSAIPFAVGGKYNNPSAFKDFILNAGKSIARDVVSVGMTIAKPIQSLIKGQLPDAQSYGNEPVKNLPLIGDTPNFYQSRQNLINQGYDPLAAGVYSTAGLVLKASQFLPLAELAHNSFIPKSKIIPGQIITNTGPIKEAITQESNANTFLQKKPIGSASEYYTMPKTVATNLQGSTKDLRWKFTPASEGKTELSLVKVMPKAKIGSVVDVPGYGMQQIQQGDWGPEVKLKSEIHDVAPTPVTAPEGKTPLSFVPSKPKMGFEKAPITGDQINTLNEIGKIKGVDSETTATIVKTITGKETMGELNQTDFIKAHQALSSFGEAYSPNPVYGPTGKFLSTFSPQRYYTNYLESKMGIPAATKIYNPIEEGAIAAKNLSDKLMTEYNGLFGEYAKPQYVEQRRLLDGYLRGDKNIITNNPTISDQTKKDLVDIAGKVRDFFNKTGPVLNVPYEVFINDYLPNIQDAGGIYQTYKNTSETNLATKEFFAKQKRKGSTGSQIDDPLISGQIYINQGSKALHMGPALDTAKEFIKAIQNPDIQNNLNSYVQEKLGYAGSWEKAIDSIIPSINQKMGLNLPRDTSRKVVQGALTSMYSGLLSSPVTAFRQIFQIPTFIQARLGTRFAGEAMVKALSPEGMAEVASKGFLTEGGVPYGQELLGTDTPAGKTKSIIGSIVKVPTKPVGFMDSMTRSYTYQQSKLQWQDAIAKYNEGKINWTGFETAIDLKNGFLPADRLAIRTKLLNGDTEGAFNSYVRSIMDETNFPYRKASGAEIGYEMKGKLATGLLNYQIEGANVVGNWIANKQWDKLVRFIGGSAATYGTLKEYGLDFKKTLLQTPNFYSPVVKGARDTINMITAWFNNNQKDFNSNKDQIIKTIFSSLPYGVEAKNVNNFKKSIQAGQDQNGNYAIYDSTGKLSYNGDFTDLVVGTLMGFPTQKKTDNQSFYTDVLNQNESNTQIKNQLDELIRNGDEKSLKKAEEIIIKTGITPSQNAAAKQFIPQAVRAFDTLSPLDKSKYADRFSKLMQ